MSTNKNQEQQRSGQQGQPQQDTSRENQNNPNRGLGSSDEELQRNVSTEGGGQSQERSNMEDDEMTRRSGRTAQEENQRGSQRGSSDSRSGNTL